MTNRMKCWIVTIVLFAVPPCFAQNLGTYYPSAQLLISRCEEVVKGIKKKSFNVQAASWCMGFVQGDLDAHVFYQIFLSTKEKGYHAGIPAKDLKQLMAKHRLFCLPDKLKLAGIIVMIVQFALKNPSLQSQRASVVVYAALRSAYPCKVKKNSTQNNLGTLRS